MSKPKKHSAETRDRMKADAEMIQDKDHWPSPHLHLKSQAWIEGEQLFGFLESDQAPFKVEIKGLNETFLEYDTIDELTERWTVD